MDLVLAPIAGGIIGWVASILLTINSRIAVLATIVICAVETFLGVTALNAMVAHPDGPVGGWVLSILGAALLVALLQVVGGLREMAAARQTSGPMRGVRRDGWRTDVTEARMEGWGSRALNGTASQ